VNGLFEAHSQRVEASATDDSSLDRFCTGGSNKIRRSARIDAETNRQNRFVDALPAGAIERDEQEGSRIRGHARVEVPGRLRGGKRVDDRSAADRRSRRRASKNELVTRTRDHWLREDNLSDEV